MKLAPALLLLVVSVAQAAAGESQPLMYDFQADWCGPCRQMRPAVDALTAKGYPIKAVDIDRSKALAAKYNVAEVPTFIVVDAKGREIARTSGAQPAKQLAQFYLDAREKLADRSGDRGADEDSGVAEEDPADEADEPPADEADDGLTEEEQLDRARQRPVNPRPWETVVRIKVYNGNSVGFGSGTVVYSSNEESLILTCAHIFKVGDKRIPPAKFANKIGIDLFNGRLKVVDGKHQLTCIEEGIPGKAVDYDFDSDVGLIRIKRGNLPYAHIVPSYWTPQVRMSMTTVGCSEGHDATAWSTMITKAPSRMFPENPKHLAIECETAPHQGRSGGGLFSDNGFVVGVCNFAEPRGNKGLYAAPESIYNLLDRNKLAALYAPPSFGDSNTLLASSGAAGRRAAAGTVRGQSPDRDEAPRRVARQGEVTMPEYGIVLGDDPLPSRGSSRKPQVQAASSKAGDRPFAWSRTHADELLPQRNEEDVVLSTDLDLDRAVDNSRFEPPAYEDDAEDSRFNDEDVAAPRKESRKPATPARSSSVGWRPAGSGR